MEMIKIHN